MRRRYLGTVPACQFLAADRLRLGRRRSSASLLFWALSFLGRYQPNGPDARHLGRDSVCSSRHHCRYRLRQMNLNHLCAHRLFVAWTSATLDHVVAGDAEHKRRVCRTKLCGLPWRAGRQYLEPHSNSRGNGCGGDLQTARRLSLRQASRGASWGRSLRYRPDRSRTRPTWRPISPVSADGLAPVAGEGVPDSAPPRVKRAYGDPQISLGLLDSQAIRHRVNAKEKIALRDLGVLSNW